VVHVSCKRQDQQQTRPESTHANHDKSPAARWPGPGVSDWLSHHGNLEFTGENAEAMELDSYAAAPL